MSTEARDLTRAGEALLNASAPNVDGAYRIWLTKMVLDIADEARADGRRAFAALGIDEDTEELLTVLSEQGIRTVRDLRHRRQ